MFFLALAIPASAIQVGDPVADREIHQPGDAVEISVKVTNDGAKKIMFVSILDVVGPDDKTAFNTADAKKPQKIQLAGGKTETLKFSFTLSPQASAGPYRARFAVRSPFAKQPFYRHRNGEAVEVFRIGGISPKPETISEAPEVEAAPSPEIFVAAFSGVVQDEREKPLENVKVAVGDQMTTTKQPDGGYSLKIPNVKRGDKFTINFSVDGSVSQSRELTFEDQRVPVFDLPITLVKRPNQPPSVPRDVRQTTGDGIAVAIGGMIRQPQILLKGKIDDPEGLAVSLEVQVAPVGASFSQGQTVKSGLLPSGAEAMVTITGLTDGAYTWRYRALDALGERSQWTEFGGNPTSSADFFVEQSLAPVGRQDEPVAETIPVTPVTAGTVTGATTTAPDIAVVEIKTSPADPQTLEAYGITVVIKNVGTIPIPAGSIMFPWKLRKKGEAWPNVGNATYGNLQNLVAGGSVEIVTTLKVTPMEPGTYDFEIDAALGGSLRDLEINKADNRKAIEILVAENEKKADAIVKEIQVDPKAPAPNTQIVIQATIANQGDIQAAGLASRIRILKGTEVVKQTWQTASAVGPGGSFGFRFVVPGLEAGIYEIEVVTDPENKIREKDESNNQRQVALTVSAEGATTTAPDRTENPAVETKAAQETKSKEAAAKDAKPESLSDASPAATPGTAPENKIDPSPTSTRNRKRSSRERAIDEAQNAVLNPDISPTAKATKVEGVLAEPESPKKDETATAGSAAPRFRERAEMRRTQLAMRSKEKSVAEDIEARSSLASKPTEVPPASGEMQKTELDPAGLTFRTDGNVRASFGDRSLVVRAPGLDAGWTIQFDFPADEKTSFKVAVGKAFKVKLDLRESPLKFAGAGMVEAVRPGEARVVFQSLQVSFDGEESMDNIELPVTVTASGSGQVPVGTLKISVSPGEEVEE